MDEQTRRSRRRRRRSEGRSGGRSVGSGPSVGGFSYTVLRPTRRAGAYLIGPKLCPSPVKCLVQRLGRRKDVDQFYHVKMLILNDSAQAADERHGRMLIHTELSVLSVLRGVRGVVQVRDFFTDVCLVEEVSESGSGHAADDKMQNKKELLVDGRRKTVKELNRVCLVTDCLFPHEFSPESQQFINLQHYAIKHHQSLSGKLTVVIFYNLACVVKTLHEMNVVHRDIKLANIILHQQTKEVTLINFCLARRLRSEGELLTDQRGSPAYISPEVLSGKPYDAKPCDMWAMGVVLYSLLFGAFPFYDPVPSELFNKIKRVVYEIPDNPNVPQSLKRVIRGLLHFDPVKRWKAAQLVSEVEKVIEAEKKTTSPQELDLQVVPNVEMDEDQQHLKESKVQDLTQSSTQSTGGVGGMMFNLIHLNTDSRLSRKTYSNFPAWHWGSQSSLSSLPSESSRTLDDGRELTEKEQRVYASLMAKMRQHKSSGRSTTGQLLPSGNRREDDTSQCPEPVDFLISSRSSLLPLVMRASLQQGPAPPMPAFPCDATVPFIDKDAVLDLSDSRRPPGSRDEVQERDNEVPEQGQSQRGWQSDNLRSTTMSLQSEAGNGSVVPQVGGAGGEAMNGRCEQASSGGDATAPLGRGERQANRAILRGTTAGYAALHQGPHVLASTSSDTRSSVSSTELITPTGILPRYSVSTDASIVDRRSPLPTAQHRLSGTTPFQTGSPDNSLPRNENPSSRLMSVREALLEMDPDAVLRSDNILSRGQVDNDR